VILLKASRKAVQVPFDGDEDEPGDDDDNGTNDAYRRLWNLAIQGRKQGETVEQAFARLHAEEKHRDLVTAEKRLHNARVAKAMGIGP
jgi:hypothetical protein